MSTAGIQYRRAPAVPWITATLLCAALATPAYGATATARPAPAQAGAAPAAPIEVMIVGTYHLDKPGLDLNNVAAEDVTTPKRQAELAEVARRLARFRPTKVAELAEFAERTGRTSLVEMPMNAGKQYVGEIEARRRAGTIGDVLVWMNDPAETVRMHRVGYYGVLPAGAGKEFPGAELNAMWFLRNAKIWAKLTEVAQPGDRVLVVYGAGHNYWLREFAAGTPGFRLAETNGYLAER